jgi:glycosyltransferase involved in cell wall biosynthesis
MVEIVEILENSDGSSIIHRLCDPSGDDHVLLRRHGVVVDDDALARLVSACARANAATSSPVPCTAASRDAVAAVHLHDRVPPPASIALPCPQAMVVSREALRSLPFLDVNQESVDTALLDVCRQLVHTGWRHVTVPGTALNWNAADVDRIGGRRGSVGAELAGPANEGLATQMLWTDYSLRSPRIVVDGACLTNTPHNGSQKLVVNVTQSLKHVRPAASVTLAVDREYVEHFRGNLRGVDVIERSQVAHPFDLVYRPYQLLDPAELPWLARVGQRLLTGQLDMIGFSNPSYHPSHGLFHAVRNLQRRVLRLADGVVFISEFGRQLAHAECPDLDAHRLFVVSCGAQSDVPPAADAPATPNEFPEKFVLCLSATFSHKNRPHALRVFERLCDHYGFDGALVIVGPEPFYGRSNEAEQRLLDEMSPGIRARVVRLGQVDEPTKWWLLRSARLVLYPSVVEGFGLVPFEAAAVGTPSIGFSGSGLQEMLDGAPCLVSTWKVDEWARVAHDAIDDRERALSIVDAINRAALDHTWNNVAELTWAAIDATVAAPRASIHHEEGGRDSRVAPANRALGTGARATHLTHRLGALAKRRLRGAPGT